MRRLVFILALFIPSIFVNAYEFNAPLQEGMSGEDVYQLQQILVTEGFLTTEPTGFFGKETLQAVADFQRSRNLDGLGYVGPATRDILSAYSQSSYDFSTSTDTGFVTFINGASDLSEGSRGQEVVVVQKFLAEEGYFKYPEFTGYFGPITAQAMRDFQNESNLVETGTFDVLTKAKIIVNKMTIVIKELTVDVFKRVAPKVTEKVKEAVTIKRGRSGGGGGHVVNSNATSTATTTPSDTAAPVITVLGPTGSLLVGTATTSLSVSTNEDSQCRYSATAAQPFASFTAFTATGNTSHVTQLTGLTNGTNYTYYVRCVDPSDNLSTESAVNFSVADLNSPLIELQGITSSEVVSGTVSLTASTSDDGVVQGVTFFADSLALGAEDASAPFTADLVTTALSEGSHLVFAVARDDTGAYGTSTQISITVDNAGPVISSVSTSSVSTSSVTISWVTNEQASAFIRYGGTVSYGSGTSNTATGTSHSLTLPSLQEGTEYHFQIQSIDALGNISTSSDFMFTTDSVSGLGLLGLDSRIAWLGNSKDAASFVSSHWQWAAVSYGGRYYVSPHGIQSRGGDDTNDYLARWAATAATKPHLVIVGDETNNLANPSQSLTNYDTIISNARAIGAIVAIQKTPASPSITGSNEVNRATINAGLDSRAADDVIILNTPSVYDGNDATLSYDGVHENFKGSFAVGQYIGGAVAAIIDPTTLLPSSGQLVSNMNTAWDMSGTTGTLQTGITGQVASNWTADNDTGATAIASKGTLNSQTAQIIQVTGTPTSGSADLRIFRTITTPLVAGEFYEVIAEVELTGTDGISAPTGVTRYEVAVGQSAMFSRYSDSNTQGVVEPFSGVFRSAPDVVTTNGSSFTVGVTLRLEVGASVNAQLKVGRVFVRKIDQVAYEVPYDQSVPGDAGAALYSKAVISGTATQGSTLTTTPGNFSGGGLTYTYQWNRAGSPISGANSRTYILTAEDVGSQITVTVTATNTYGSDSATSNPTSPVS